MHRLLAVTGSIFGVVLLIASAYLTSARWPDQNVDGWVAVGSLATLVTTCVAIAGLVGIVLLRSEARRARQQMRAEIGPYLRVDVYTEFPGGTFVPPADNAPRYDWAAFNLSEPRPPSHLDAWLKSDGVRVLLRVENQQTHRAGVAHSIAIDVEIQVPSTDDPSGEPLRHTEAVTFHYVEPGKAVMYEVSRLNPDIPFVTGRVLSIVYFDLFNRPLHFAHGSGTFEVGSAGGIHVNSRRVFFEEIEVF